MGPELVVGNAVPPSWPEQDDAIAAGDLSTFTIGDFLALPVTVQGAPVVLAGTRYSSRRIRWLHVVELVDTAGLLQGGELILTTGIALPDAPEQIVDYIDALAEQGVAGLVIELGRRFSEVPPVMVRACERRDVPLIALRREVQFVRMTESAHSIILMGQRRLLQVTAAAHQRYTELSSANASVEELITAAGALAEGHVVFANLLHQVVGLHARGALTEVLNRWNQKTFTVNRVFGTRVDDVDRTVVTPVEVRGQQRGRLVLFAERPPTPAQVIVVERAAAAIAVRLLFEDDNALVSNAQRTILTCILTARAENAPSLHARTAALGHPTRGRHYLPLVLLSERNDMDQLVGRALAETRLDALSGQLEPGRQAVLLLLSGDQPGPPAEAFAAAVHDLSATSGAEPPVIGRGALVSELADVRGSLAEATDVALACRACATSVRRRHLYSIADIQLRELLFTLRGDPRVQSFVERTLGPLLLRDARDGTTFVRTVAVYLRVQGNKSLAARNLGISRQTLYERIARIQRMLRLDFDDPETTASLYAAIMFVESVSLVDPMAHHVPPTPTVGSATGTLTDCQLPTPSPDRVPLGSGPARRQGRPR